MNRTFEVVRRAYNSRYANGDDIRLVNLGPVALFSIFKQITSTGKHLEDFSHAHIVSLMYKLISSARDSDDLSIGLNLDRNRRRNELTNEKNIKGKLRVRLLPKDIFGFAEHHEKTTYGLGYKLTLAGNKENSVFQRAVVLAVARIKIAHIHWCVPRYTPSIQRQGILSKLILSKTPTELGYIE